MISFLYRAHLCIKNSLGIPNFLEEISSLSRSVVFLCFFAFIAEEGLSLLAILWNSAFNWEYLSFSPLLFASILFFYFLFINFIYLFIYLLVGG